MITRRQARLLAAEARVKGWEFADNIAWVGEDDPRSRVWGILSEAAFGIAEINQKLADGPAWRRWLA